MCPFLVTLRPHLTVHHCVPGWQLVHTSHSHKLLERLLSVSPISGEQGNTQALLHPGFSVFSLLHVCWCGCTQDNLQESVLSFLRVQPEFRSSDSRNHLRAFNPHSEDLNSSRQACTASIFNHRVTFPTYSCTVYWARQLSTLSQASCRLSQARLKPNGVLLRPGS